MSKTYRRGEAKGRRRGTDECDVWVERGVRRSEQPERITPEWALARMENAITFAVKTLLDDEIIPTSEAQDCEQEIRIRVARASERYDAERKGARGRNASAVHYLNVVIDSTRKNIIRAFGKYGPYAKEIPCDVLRPKEGDGWELDDTFNLSDDCRSVRELDWRMDMESIRNLMTPRQRKSFEMMCCGRSAEEAMDEVGVFGGSFYRRVLEPIRGVLRKCGYAPLGQNEDC